MITGRITGEMTSTINHPFYDGKKMLVVERTDDSGARTGETLVAVDAVDAGIGQDVLILDEGNGARQVYGSSSAPVRTVIVGIIDAVVIEPTT